MPEGLPFAEAIDFLRAKTRLPTRAWTDLRGGAHARSFVVAGAQTDTLLGDFHAAVLKGVTEGTTSADFLRDFDGIVAKHGWDYRGGRTWRARVIYDTNMRMAHAAGRWAQIERATARETKAGRVLYLRYIAVLDAHTRPEHRAWHGIVLPATHPWWRTHYPPNGWRCRCTIQVLTERDLARYGYTPTADADAPEVKLERRQVTLADGSTEIWETPEGIDTGFGYNVGQSWLDGAVPPPLSGPLPPPSPPAVPRPGLPPLPSPRPMPAGVGLLPDGLPDADYIRSFLAPFGADIGKSAPYRDPAGHLLAIGHELFIDRRATAIAKRTNPEEIVWKVEKRGRHQMLPYLAQALIDPDEIWVDWFLAKGGMVLRRRYLRAFEGDFQLITEDARGKRQPVVNGVLSALEWTRLGWVGRTLHPTSAELDEQRHGALLYRRKD